MLKFKLHYMFDQLSVKYSNVFSSYIMRLAPVNQLIIMCCVSIPLLVNFIREESSR